jgi:hypothetical protein
VFHSVYIKSDYDKGVIRTYVFRDPELASRFAAGAEADGTYWGKRVTEKLPTESERDRNFAPAVIMD